MFFTNIKKRRRLVSSGDVIIVSTPGKHSRNVIWKENGIFERGRRQFYGNEKQPCRLSLSKRTAHRARRENGGRETI